MLEKISLFAFPLDTVFVTVLYVMPEFPNSTADSYVYSIGAEITASVRSFTVSDKTRPNESY